MQTQDQSTEFVSVGLYPVIRPGHFCCMSSVSPSVFVDGAESICSIMPLHNSRYVTATNREHRRLAHNFCKAVPPSTVMQLIEIAVAVQRCAAWRRPEVKGREVKVFWRADAAVRGHGRTRRQLLADRARNVQGSASFSQVILIT
ncbi:hypothetical protein J6590_068881 [Homalodisca vitripennis]|nr:hypothetical protein J6590_068881 [Homalodisca vitripennis]